MTQCVDAEELKMILWSKDPYLCIAQIDELGPGIDIFEGAVSQVGDPGVKIHSAPRRRGVPQRRCGSGMLFRMEVQIDIARRSQPALRVKASHGPSLSQNRINP
jgi:hypothetical protein